MFGIVTVSKIERVNNNKGNIFKKLAYKAQEIIESNVRTKIQNKEQQDVLLGILLGKDDGISEETKENFTNSSLSHILAVSGMHVAYVMMIIDYLFSKLNIGKRKTKVITIFSLIFFILLTNGTTSVKRACIMAVLGIVATLVNRKSDTINNMAISLLIILIQNPFSLFNTGLILSYTATLGIVLLSPIFMHEENKQKQNIWKKFFNQKIKPIIIVSICAQIAILPISIALFGSISLTFIFSNLFISFIIGIIILLGFIICIPINIPVLPELLSLLLSILLKISEFFANLPLSHILVSPPNLIILICYYTVILIWIYFKNVKREVI